VRRRGDKEEHEDDERSRHQVAHERARRRGARVGDRSAGADQHRRRRHRHRAPVTRLLEHLDRQRGNERTDRDQLQRPARTSVHLAGQPHQPGDDQRRHEPDHQREHHHLRAARAPRDEELRVVAEQAQQRLGHRQRVQREHVQRAHRP
jgi:hypothetical protein